MRITHWAIAGVCALAMSGTANAQNFQSGLTGVRPSDVTFRQVDTGSVVQGTPSLPTSMQSRWSFSSFFRKVTNFGSTTRGSSNIPAQQYPNIVEPLRPTSSRVR